MDDELDIFFESAGAVNYLESIIRSQILLEQLPNADALKSKLDYLIALEIDLAIVGAEKATGEVKKSVAKVSPIKGV